MKKITKQVLRLARNEQEKRAIEEQGYAVLGRYVAGEERGWIMKLGGDKNAFGNG